MADDSIDPRLMALLATLLPGSSEWPTAADTHTAAFIVTRARALPDLGNALDAVRALLPVDFISRDPSARAAALRDIESRIPGRFAQVVEEAYRGYYTDPRVLALIERQTGYPARPPQPLGRQVRPADWSALEQRAIAPAPLPALLTDPDQMPREPS